MFGFDLATIIQAIGYTGIFFLVFAESGLLIGFFLPGDSLLFTAGILAAAGIFNIYILVPVIFCASVLGNEVGYYIGKKAGEKLFHREESLFFRKSNVEKAQKFFKQHGERSVIIARFVPVIRTFVPVLAGIGKMDYTFFYGSNLMGGLIWGCGLPLAGFFLGAVVPDIDKYLLPIIGVIILASLVPVVKMWFVEKNS